MNPIQLLMEEHRRIEKAIAALRAYARRVAAGEDLPRADLAGFVRFIRGYADAHHHGKEEDILFAALVQHGMPRDMGPLGVMFAEHDEGRRFTASLAEQAEAEGDWDASGRTQVGWAAQGYADLLLAHIQKEDQVLYPMADQMLPEATWKEIERTFEIFEADPDHGDRRKELEAVADDLAARYR